MMLQRADEQKVLKRLDESLALAHCPLTMLLNKLSLVWELGMAEDGMKTRKELFSLAPCDRRVFASLALNEETLQLLMN